MDIIAITPIQQLLWILLAFLLAWMITFAWLAIKRTPEATVESKEIAYYQPLPTKVAAKQLHIEAPGPIQVPLATSEATSGIYLERSVR